MTFEPQLSSILSPNSFVGRSHPPRFGCIDRIVETNKSVIYVCCIHPKKDIAITIPPVDLVHVQINVSTPINLNADSQPGAYITRRSRNLKFLKLVRCGKRIGSKVTLSNEDRP